MMKLRAAWSVVAPFFKQAAPFVLKHWKIILIVLLSAALFLKMRADYRSMQDSYEARLKSSEEQIAGLKEIHKVQMKEMQALMDALLIDLKRIEEDRDRAREELKVRQSERISENEKNWSEHPEDIIRQFEDEFGFKYVE